MRRNAWGRSLGRLGTRDAGIELNGGIDLHGLAPFGLGTVGLDGEDGEFIPRAVRSTLSNVVQASSAVLRLTAPGTEGTTIPGMHRENSAVQEPEPTSSAAFGLQSGYGLRSF